MAIFVVVGAGPVGRETARLLAAEGNEVRLVSRSGAAATTEGVTSVALDARDGQSLARTSKGADAIFMCAMAPYTSWPSDFPPIMEGVAVAAESTDAGLIILGNVYGYGDGAPLSLTPSTRLAPTSAKGRVRTAIWERALGSAVSAIEVRASDYLGAGAASLFTLAALPRLLAGRPTDMPGDLDILHPWSFIRDVARTLVAASRYSGTWGRAFHVPSPHVSIRELAARFAKLAGAPAPELHALTEAALRKLADEDAFMREVEEIAYLYEKPWIIDASDTEQLLGVFASDLDTIIKDTLNNRQDE